MKTYCVFCRTGAEYQVSKLIGQIHQEIQVIVPVRILQERCRGIWEERKKPLIPGYVFLFVEETVTFDYVRRILDVYKVLDYGVGVRELLGADFEYAKWIHVHHGVIGPSKILEEGEEIKILEGPLCNCVGKIVKLDRRKKRAWVEFDFDGRKQKISLSVDNVVE
jgi:transcription antitermination factor NusG